MPPGLLDDQRVSFFVSSCDFAKCYQSLYCCGIWYCLSGKFFTNSSKRIRCEVMFENEHRSAREYIMFTSAQLLRSWSEQRPSKKFNLDSRVTGEVRRVDLFMISFCTVICCCLVSFCAVHTIFPLSLNFVSYISL